MARVCLILPLQLKDRVASGGGDTVFDELVEKAICGPGIPVLDGDGETKAWKGTLKLVFCF